MRFPNELNPQLTLDALSRIERLNATARAFITVMREAAAERKIAGGHRPPLQGIPVAVKDLFDTKGIRTTAGSKVFADRVPREDAAVVRKLKDAGAAIVGKTNMHEFAFGLTNVNPHYGTPQNPWDPERICGGSSGGSASAVAFGMAVGSIGTDTGGSIRIPAAFCGIVGLKPTYGLIDVTGVIPLSMSLDHVGPMARTVEDTTALLGVLAGRDFSGALTGDIQGLRVGIPQSYFYEQLSPEVETAIGAALRTLERLGARMADIDLPSVAAHLVTWNQIALPEAYSYHEEFLKTSGHLYGDDVRTRLESGRTLLSVDYVRAQRHRTTMKEECGRVFEDVDVIVTPTVPIPAPRVADLDAPAIAQIARFTRFFNLVGLPTISVPCGFTSEGLPVGLQIVGKAFDEASVLRTAYAYEQDTRWFERLKKFS